MKTKRERGVANQRKTDHVEKGDNARVIERLQR